MVAEKTLQGCGHASQLWEGEFKGALTWEAGWFYIPETERNPKKLKRLPPRTRGHFLGRPRAKHAALIIN